MGTHKRYRMSSALILLSLVLALTQGNVQASPTRQTGTDLAAIDAYVTEQVNDLAIPGMALGVVQDGQIAHLQGFGVADSSGRAVTPQTPFLIGSLSKSFTALAVMQLVEAGKIDPDAPVQTYLPWFELADAEASAQITVRHLLNHTSGIADKDGDRFWASRLGLEEAVRGFNELQLSEPVGTTYQYSNINYGTAGLIVEKVSGQPYAEYVARHIFEPLEMRHAYASRMLALADGLAEGHHYLVGRPIAVEQPVPPVYVPSGMLIASAEDMAHYLIAHLNEGWYGDTAVLSAQGMAELHAPAIPEDGEGLYYAMGWDVGTLEGSPFLAHHGALPNYWGEIFMMPDADWGIVLLANANGFEQLTQITMVAHGVVRLLMGQAPGSVSLYFPLRFLYWTILLTPLLMIAGVAHGWRKWRLKGVALPWWVVGLYGGIALLWLFGVPPLMRQRLGSGMRVWYPELYYGLIAAAALGIGLSVIVTVINLRARRSK